MKRVGIFVDLSNLYHSVSHKYRRKLDFRRYFAFLADLGSIQTARAYGAQMGKESDRFIEHLRAAGFDPQYKKPKSFMNRGQVTRKADWDIGITMDIVVQVAKLDLIVIGSADGDFEPLVQWLLDQGKEVLILGCKISKDLREITTCIEIPESFMEDRK